MAWEREARLERLPGVGGGEQRLDDGEVRFVRGAGGGDGVEERGEAGAIWTCLPPHVGSVIQPGPVLLAGTRWMGTPTSGGVEQSEEWREVSTLDQPIAQRA